MGQEHYGPGRHEALENRAEENLNEELKRRRWTRRQPRLTNQIESSASVAFNDSGTRMKLPNFVAPSDVRGIPPQIRVLKPASLRTIPVIVLALFLFSGFNGRAQMPSDYQGKPFDVTAYRVEQERLSNQPKLPYRAFKSAEQLWCSTNAVGSGWVSEGEPGISVGLDEPDKDGRRVIHFRASLKNYRYAAFGWNWASPAAKGVDLSGYGAVSFSLRVAGTNRPQELFFGISETQPAPLSLRDYDPDLLNGSWRRIVIPLKALKWNAAGEELRNVRGFTFMTFVWDKAEFEVLLDDLALERAVKPELVGKTKLSNHSLVRSFRGQPIPGRLECAFYDLGGEGVAYHDTTPMNTLSAVLNQNSRHQRPHATSFEWNFRREEGVDISFTKDWADLNHTNFFEVKPNQLYIGSTEDGEWCQYTVEVKRAGSYRIVAAYGNDNHGQQFQLSLNHQPAAVCQVPLVTGSMHKWNQAEVSRIEFPKAGRQLLTLHYGRGFNLAYLDFIKAEKPKGVR